MILNITGEKDPSEQTKRQMAGPFFQGNFDTGENASVYTIINNLHGVQAVKGTAVGFQSGKCYENVFASLTEVKNGFPTIKRPFYDIIGFIG